MKSGSVRDQRDSGVRESPLKTAAALVALAPVSACGPESDFADERAEWCADNPTRLFRAAGLLLIDIALGPRPGDPGEVKAWEEDRATWPDTAEGIRACDSAWDHRHEAPAAAGRSA